MFFYLFLVQVWELDVCYRGTDLFKRLIKKNLLGKYLEDEKLTLLKMKIQLVSG